MGVRSFWEMGSNMPRFRAVVFTVVATLALSLLPAEASRRRAVGPLPNTLWAYGDSYAVQQGDAVTVAAASGVLANDYDPKKKVLSATLLTNPIHGSLTFLPTGGFTYTHDGTSAPVDTFTYRATNGTDQSLAATVTITIESLRPPVAVADNYSVAFRGTLDIPKPGILVNDFDASGKTLTAIIATNPTRGTLTLRSDGSFLYKHDGSTATSDSFTYRASSGQLFSSPVAVTISIGGNAAPVVSNHSYTTPQQTPLVVAAPGVLTNAVDRDSPMLTALVVTQPAHGALVLNADGSFTYTPATGWSGPDSFTWRATDGTSQSNTATVSINVLAANSANPDFYTASMNVPRVVPAPGILANDDPGATLVSYGAQTGKEQTIIGAPASTVQGGSVAVSSNGAFVYTPPASYSGTDAFRYIIGNVAGTSIATVTITLGAAPVATPDAYSVAQNVTRAVSSPGVLDNDVTNGAAISANTQPQHGTLSLNSDGSFTYAPVAGYSGADSFTYTLSTATATSSALVTLTVYAKPVAANDSYAHPSTAPLVVSGAGAFSNDTLNSATLATYGTTGTEVSAGTATPTAQGGSVTMQAGGGFTYTPAAGFQGSDTFKYTLSNYAGSATGTVTISTILAPVAASDSYSVARNAARTIAAAEGVLANDTANGASIVSYGRSGGEQTSIGQPSATAQGGSVSLAADGSFTYTPPNLFTGVDTFRYSLFNSVGSSSATVTLNVTAAPVAVNDTFSASLNSTITIAVPGVLGNDLISGGSISSYGVNGTEQTSIGQATPTASGGSVSLNADGSFGYTPPANFTGADSFKYTLGSFSGTSTAIVTMNVAQLPVVAGDSYDVPRNGSRSVAAPGVLANDTLNGASIASYGRASATEQTIVGSPTPTMQGGTITLRADGSFTYVPASGFSGTDTFNYRLTNFAGSVTATVTFNVQSAPVAVDDNYQTSLSTPLIIGPGGQVVLTNDTLNGGTIVGYGVNGSEQATLGQSTATAQGGTVVLNADGSFTYTPSTGFAGIDSFRYTLSNFVGSATARVSIAIAQSPVANNDAYSAARNTPRTVAAPGVFANDTLNVATLASYGANGTEQSAIGQAIGTANGGSVTMSADGSFTYVPPSNFSGTDTFRYRVTNFTASVTATVTMTVFAPPVANNDSYVTSLNTTLSVPLAGVLGNDALNSSTITGYGKTGNEQASIGQATATASGGTVSLNADGSFSYTPAAGFSGSDTFQYTLTNYAGSSTATVSISVASTPTALADSYQAARNMTRVAGVAEGVLLNDAVNGGSIISYGTTGTQQTSIGNPTSTTAGGSVSLRADGSFTYVPATNFTGTDTFQYRLGNALSTASAVVTITVFAPPLAATDSYTTPLNTTLSVAVAGVLANDTISSATITAYGKNGTEQTTIGQAAATSGGGTVSLNANGSFSYTPASGFTGNDAFQYTLTNYAGSSTAVVTIAVAAAPAVVPDTYQAARNTTRVVDASAGVLLNDTVSGGTIVSYGSTGTQQTSIGNATATTAGGSVSLRADGSFTYVPANNFTGIDTFQYRLGNALSTVTGLVTITVFAPPLGVNDGHTTAINAALNITSPGVLSNDTLNSGAISAYGKTGTEQTSVGQATATNGGGSIVLRADGSFSYTPASGYSGSDTFKYTLTNYAGSSTAIVTIGVASVPVAIDDSYTVPRNGSRNEVAPGVLANDTQNAAPIVSFGVTGTEQTTLGQTTVTAQGGVIALRADGSFTYTPPASFAGSDTFRYRLTSSAGSSTATVTFTVVALPVAVNDSYQTARNTSLLIPPGASAVTANDSVNGAAITGYGVNGTEQASLGVLTATSGGGTVALSADGSFAYVPATNYVGTDTFKYTLTNVAGTSIAIVSIAVVQAPVAVADSYQAARNTPRTVTLAEGVLTNDSVNGATIISYGTTGTQQSVIGSAAATTAGGTVSLNANGSFSYTPASNYSGTDTFQYRLSNSLAAVNATVTITVFAPPVVASDSYATAINVTLNVSGSGVLGNDTKNGATITGYGKATGAEQTSVGQSTATSGGGTVSLHADGTFSYTPAVAFSGTDSFRYTLTNYAGAVVGTVAITVMPLPVAVTDSYTARSGTTHSVTAPGVLANDTINGGSISNTGARTTTSGGTATLFADGSFSYTPAAGFAGVDSFTYSLANAVASSTASVVFTVIAAPVAVNDTFTARVNTAGSYPAPGVLANDTANGGTFSATGTLTTVNGGIVTLNANGSFSYTPLPNFSGNDSFTYTLTNVVGSSTATVTISVINVPVATNDAFINFSTTGGTVTAPGVLANDFPNGGSIVSPGVARGTTRGGTVTLQANGSFTYTPPSGWDGADNFTYTITNAVGSSTATAQILVPLPAAANDSYTVCSFAGNGTVSGNIFANDTRNLATLTGYGITAVSNRAIGEWTPTAFGRVRINADGSFLYEQLLFVPFPFTFTDVFFYELTNGAGSDTAAISILIETFCGA